LPRLGQHADGFIRVTSPQGNGRSLLGPADFFAIRNFLGLRTLNKIDVHC
jgi:hypothetical protein